MNLLGFFYVCVWCEVSVKVSFFFFSLHVGYPVVPAPFAKKTSVSPLNCLGTFVENPLVMYV